MADNLENKSLNPYDQKKKKHQGQSMEERHKIEQLMHASYLESSFYNVYYKNSQMASGTQNNKKIRFAEDQDESNFGLEPPTLENGQDLAMKTGIGFKSGFKKL